MTKSINKHIGSSLDDFLKEGELYETSKAVAVKRGLENIKKGHVSGPFASADDVINHLHIIAKQVEHCDLPY